MHKIYAKKRMLKKILKYIQKDFCYRILEIINHFLKLQFYREIKLFIY